MWWCRFKAEPIIGLKVIHIVQNYHTFHLRSRSPCSIQLLYHYIQTKLDFLVFASRALQWSGTPYGNGYGLEMDRSGAQFVKRLWIGLDLGKTISLKRYNKYGTFI